MNESKEFLGDAEVTVRFEFEPECMGHGAHPDHDAIVTIEEVCIGGVWIGSNFLSEEWLSRTEHLILAEKGRSLQSEAECDAWERNQEYLMENGGFP